MALPASLDQRATNPELRDGADQADTRTASERVTSTSHGPRNSAALRLPKLLIVGDPSVATLCTTPSLAESYLVQTVGTLAGALVAIRSVSSGVILTELDLSDGDGVELCRAAKASRSPRLVLVTTPDAARVPRALAAGCDSVLLKPFAPMLLFSRLRRLARDLQMIAREPAVQATAGTNQRWPSIVCTRCRHRGVTTFDATSLRRAWYACLECENVWVARQPRGG